MYHSNQKRFVKLSRWIIDFVEGVNDDFDIVFKGIVGENNIFLTMDDNHTTNPVVTVIRYNKILCDGDVYVILEGPINERMMGSRRFTSEFTSCFKYGFPNNWVAVAGYFFSQMKSQNDLKLPRELLEVAHQDMENCRSNYIMNTIDISNWYIELHLNESRNDFNVVLIGYINDSSSDNDGRTCCEVVVREREYTDVILCGRAELYKLATPIDYEKMMERRYPASLIESFKFGFPSNWVQILLELFYQYENSDGNYADHGQASGEMGSFRPSQQFDSAIYSDYLSTDDNQHLQEEDVIRLEGGGFIDIESSLPPSLLSGVFKPVDEVSRILPRVDTPIVDFKESGECLQQSQEPLLSDFSTSGSAVSSLSLLNSSNKSSDSDASLNMDLDNQNNNDLSQITDYFQCSENPSLLHESWDDILEEENQNKSELFEMSKMSNTYQSSDYRTNPEKFFNDSLGLGDMVNTSRDKFNFTDCSLNQSMTPENVSEVTRRPIFYLPAAKHIQKSKSKPKKTKINRPIENIIDFEKLVYEEIERKREYDPWGLSEMDDSSL